MKIISYSILSVLINLSFSSNVLFAAEYKVAVRAHHGIEVAINQWRPTLDILNNRLPEHKFTLVPILNLEEISKQAKLGEIDFVLTNPSSYVEIAQLYGAKALVTLNNKRANTAQSRFGSVIFTHVNHTDIKTIKDLKNKTFMAVSKPAFGGWRVAWAEMLEQGFDPLKELKSLSFAKNKTQPEVIQAVLDGKADAGVVRTDLLERLETADKIDMRYLRILNSKDIEDFPFFLSTKLYPEWAFAMLKHVPPVHGKKIADTLLTISKDSVAAKSGKYMGWIKPKDYKPVQELMKRLKVGPYANL